MSPVPDFVLALRDKIGHDPLWLPGVTAVVRRADQVLLVRRADDGSWTPITGISDPGEEPAVTAAREALEETGWDIRVESFIGAYQWHAPGGQQYLRFAFGGVALAHDPARPLDTGIERALWLTPAELAARSNEHRSPLVWRVASDWLAGRRQPLSLLQWLP